MAKRKSKGTEEEFVPLSQWRLIWQRFKRHKVGMAAAIFTAFLFAILLFAEFISPYNPTAFQRFSYQDRERSYKNAPPTRIHFFSEEGFSIRPFVYGLNYIPARPREGIFKERYEEDRTRKYPLKLFVRGDEYYFWGLFKTNLHLFGVEKPGVLFLFGSDGMGRDLFSRTLAGGRISLAIGLIVILVSFIAGIPLGGLSGYYGGKTDTLVQRVIEVIMGLPRLALLLALSGVLGAFRIEPIVRFWAIALMIAFVSWPPLARVIRGQFLALREEDFIAAARALGAGDMRVILKHILPNTMSYLVVTATLTIPNVIILESTLSFLGYGIREPMMSWGLLLNDAQNKLLDVLQNYPWYLIPGGFIIVTVLIFNFLGDALRDAVDPFTVPAVKEEKM